MALGGCASLTTPDTSPPLTPVPTAWFAVARPAAAVQGQGKTPTALAQWWQRFNDPQLTALVEQALLANTDVRSAQAALRQARAQREARVAVLLPNVGAGVSGQRNTTGGNIAATATAPAWTRAGNPTFSVAIAAR